MVSSWLPTSRAMGLPSPERGERNSGAAAAMPCPEMLQGMGTQPWPLPCWEQSVAVVRGAGRKRRLARQGVGGAGGRRQDLSPHTCTISHWTWLRKHKFKNMIIKCLKIATTEHSAPFGSARPFWMPGPIWASVTALVAHSWNPLSLENFSYLRK